MSSWSVLKLRAAILEKNPDVYELELMVDRPSGFASLYDLGLVSQEAILVKDWVEGWIDEEICNEVAGDRGLYLYSRLGCAWGNWLELEVHKFLFRFVWLLGARLSFSF